MTLPACPPARALPHALLLLACAASVSAQGESEAARRIAGWVALDAPTGHEHHATRLLNGALEGWETDRHGNLLRRVGAGRPRRVVACGLDWNAFVVSQIRADGYLRLHRLGPGTGQALWDQAHEGQQVRILTAEGPVLGVTAIANGHFAQQHRNERDVVTADDLWVDVGAESAADVGAMGIGLLDPVVRHLPAWTSGPEVAGPGAGARTGCAAVASASRGAVDAGETVFLLSAQHVFGWVGLGGALIGLAPVDEVIVVAPGEEGHMNEMRAADFERRLAPVLRAAGVDSVRYLAPAVSDPGALMERIAVGEADALLDAVVAAAGVRTPGERWVAAPPSAAVRNTAAPWLAGDARLRDVAALLDSLVELPAVPGHEGPVRAAVLAAMPGWARDQAQTDELGNVWVAVGPPRDTTVFMAHMDEVGYVITEIAADGTVSLAGRGGVIPSAWEGQPARVQLDSARQAASAPTVRQLDGVFLTRAEPEGKRPRDVRAWFGLDAAGLARAGVTVGMGVTGYKEGHRIGRYRYTGRSLDDRAGTTALLVALRALEPASLEHTVIFAWSVQEEGGLNGAAAMAQRFGATTRRIYSVDTFVSSDTPLESPHFAWAPLGAGPVLRSVENSSLATPAERERNLRIARNAGIAVQVGLTQGGTDGTTFTFWGAPNAGLSWPGRYSHSPAEVLDLRDLARLPALILAIASGER